MPQDWLTSLNKLSPSASEGAIQEEDANLFEAWTNVDFTSSTVFPHTDGLQAAAEQPLLSPLGHTLDFDSDLSFTAYKSNNRKNYELGFGKGTRTPISPFVGVSAVDPNVLLSGTSSGLRASDGSNLLVPATAAPLDIVDASPQQDWLDRLRTVNRDSSFNLHIDPALSTSTAPASAATKPTTKTTSKKARAGSNAQSTGSLDMDSKYVEPVTELAVVEEDKRRRNTEASARFRVKKKQREQALADEANNLRSKVADMEKQMESLKMENTWLRGLIVARGQGKTVSLDQSLDAAELTIGAKRTLDQLS